MICWIILEIFMGQIHVFLLGSWLDILYICWGYSIFSLYGGIVPLVIPLIYLFFLDRREVNILYLMVRDEEGVR